MITNFDTTGYKLFSARNNSDDYISSDGKFMLKIMHLVSEDVLKELNSELEVSQKALDMGIPTPGVIDIVETKEGKTGILYEYISGKKSLSRAVSENLSLADEYGRKFAVLGKKLHSTPCDTSCFLDIKTVIEPELKASVLTEDEKDFLLEKLHSIPDASTCLHGDFQFSNAITNGVKDYFIDLGMLCCGNPVFDLGFLEIFAGDPIEDYIPQHLFHMSKENTRLMFEAFLKEYYETEDMESLKAVERELRIAGCLSCFYVGTRLNLGSTALPAIRKCIAEYAKSPLA